MDNQSNSKFYHGDCNCKKTESTSIIAVECEDCIDDNKERYFNNRRGYECSCEEIEIKHFTCKTCALYRDKIDNLNNELDNLTYHLVYDIKQFINCTDKINKIQNISLEMRHLNRKLLENLIKNSLIEDTQLNEK